MAVRQWALAVGVVLLASGCAQVQTSDVTGVTGGALGGVFGGLLGSQVGSGTGQLAATAVGSSLGALFGGAAGRSVGSGIDDAVGGPSAAPGAYRAPPPAPGPAFGADQAYVGEAQAAATGMPLGESIAWENPGTGNYGTVTAIRDGTARGGQYCREFETLASLGGRSQVSYSVACQFPDGSWRQVQ